MSIHATDTIPLAVATTLVSDCMNEPGDAETTGCVVPPPVPPVPDEELLLDELDDELLDDELLLDEVVVLLLEEAVLLDDDELTLPPPEPPPPCEPCVFVASSRLRAPHAGTVATAARNTGA
jgi:hypothetical protein